MITRTIVVVTFLLASSIAFAQADRVGGNDRGNGGDSVVCRNQEGQILSAELLDYYEGRTVRNLPVLEYPELSDEHFFENVLNSINEMEDFATPISVSEALELMGALKDYLETGRMNFGKVTITEDALVDIPDSDELFIPKGCAVEQLAIWQIPRFPEDPSFIIQAQILKKLSPKDLRGLVLHEVIYKGIVFRNQHMIFEMKSSIPVRYLHQKIMARPLGQFSFLDYFGFLRGMYNGDRKGMILKKGLYLDLYNPLINKEWMSLTVNGTQTRLVLDRGGKLDHELTYKYGSILVAPFTDLDFGEFNRYFATWWISSFGPFYRNFPGTLFGLHFGENVIKVSLKSDPRDLKFHYWGFTFKGYDLKDKKVFVRGRFDRSRQEVERRFNIGLDENFKIIIKDLK